MKELRSSLDSSVNFISDGFEARYVRRYDHYFSCYLRYFKGCNKGCKMCFLTRDKQFSTVPATNSHFLYQARKVMCHYAAEEPRAETVHFNFMAKGDPLANSHLDDDTLIMLGKLAKEFGLKSKFNISTIMPTKYPGELESRFSITSPTVYYSMYSVQPEFRDHWLPSAMPVVEAVERLESYQYHTKKIIKIHFAFIEGENDRVEDVRAMCQLLKKHKLRVEFNVIAYNPPDELSRSTRPSEVANLMEIVRGIMSEETRVKYITRVGYDVAASCGMFINLR